MDTNSGLHADVGERGNARETNDHTSNIVSRIMNFDFLVEWNLKLPSIHFGHVPIVSAESSWSSGSPSS